MLNAPLSLNFGNHIADNALRRLIFRAEKPLSAQFLF